MNGKSYDMSIAPLYLKKKITDFEKKYNGLDVLISKKRDTGYYLDTIDGKFNIDIDFIWSNYFKLFLQSNQIYIASNHQLFQMYLMNCIAAITSNIKLTFIANPYLNVNLVEAKKQYELRDMKEYKELLYKK